MSSWYPFCFYDSLIRLATSHKEEPYDKALQCMRLIHFDERWKDASNFRIIVNEVLLEPHRISFDVLDSGCRRNFWVYEDTDDVVVPPRSAFDVGAKVVLAFKKQLR